MKIVMSTCLALAMTVVAWSPARGKKHEVGTQSQAGAQTQNSQSSAQSPSGAQTAQANKRPTAQNAKDD
jgi:hypothetical protein